MMLLRLAIINHLTKPSQKEHEDSLRPWTPRPRPRNASFFICDRALSAFHRTPTGPHVPFRYGSPSFVILHQHGLLRDIHRRDLASTSVTTPGRELFAELSTCN